MTMTKAEKKSKGLTEKDLLGVGNLCLLQGGGKKRLCDLLCGGLESGPYGSFIITGYVEPKKMEFRTHEEQVFRHLDYPMNAGGAVLMQDKYCESGECDETYSRDPDTGEQVTLPGDHTFRLDLPALKRGLAILSLDYPRVYADWIKENDDALTGDALVQCALLGEVVYG